MKTKRVILAGGTGFIGGCLAVELLRHGFEIVVLTRSPRLRADGIREVAWDGKTPGDWSRELEGATAVINLAGRSVNCRYTPENRKQILESRVCSTKVIGEAIAGCKEPPRVWLNSSTATIYKHRLDKPNDESGEIAATPEAKDEFSVEVALAWERAFNDAITPATRKVTLRTSLVFGAGEGGVFRVLRRLAKFGLGGKMASGDQFVSWIHEEDFCRAIEWLIANERFSGPVNLAAPNPLTNREMMRALRRVCGAPLGIGLPATRWMLEVGAFFMRTETELILKSRCVISNRLAAGGFQFRFQKFEEAAREIETRLCESEN